MKVALDGQRAYEIVIGEGVACLDASWPDLATRRVLIVTDEHVAGLHADALERFLRPRCSGIGRVVLAGGEAAKAWPAAEGIIDALVAASHDRGSVIVALGGGVVGDVAGFAAACYMRGIDYIQVPTTLLAQVDSSVGGKTAVNHRDGKNLIGAFHQPCHVVADLRYLKTLPEREIRAGVAEVIKTAAAADGDFFDWLESNIDDIVTGATGARAYAVDRCCSLKAAIVAEDERESGRRAILNFGHTFGHAVEAGIGYGTWLHGEAVAAGMVAAGELSTRLGLLDASDAARLEALIHRAGLPVRLPHLGAAHYLELMRHDKKSLGGQLRFVVLDGLGRASMRAVDDRVLASVLEECQMEAA